MRLSLFALVIFAGASPLAWISNSACAATYQNYSEAWHTAQSTHRPLLVIFNSHDQNTRQITEQDLQSDAQIKQHLDSYVVAVIDTTTEAGKKDYELFAAPGLPRIVVIDKQQSRQIFRSQDALPNDKLANVLTQFQAGEPPAPATITANKMELPATYSQPQPAYSSCPSCQNQRYYRYSR